MSFSFGRSNSSVSNASNTVQQQETFAVTIQQALKKWSFFQWNDKAVQAVSTLQSIASQREQSLTARKQLAETTKHFKKSVKLVEQVDTHQPLAVQKAIDTVGKQSRTIVKAYQEEIDNLTRRCKTSETAYTTLCQALELTTTTTTTGGGDEPNNVTTNNNDPAMILTLCMEQWQGQQVQFQQLLQTIDSVNQEMEALQTTNQDYQQQVNDLQQQLAKNNQQTSTETSSVNNNNNDTTETSLSKAERDELVQLRREVAEYEVEFRSLKNQDITIRKLETKIAELQQTGQEQLQQQLELAKVELAETEGRRAAEALEREAHMERKVQALELELKAERAGRQATQEQFLVADEGVLQREAAWEAQKKILMDDSEGLRESLQVTSRERDELRLKIAALEGKKGGTTTATSTSSSMADLELERKAYEAEVAELAETAAVLREELRQKEEGFQQQRRASVQQIEMLEKERQSLASTLESLESQVASAPTQALVDSMKRELRILKRLEYNAEDIEVGDPEIAGMNEDGNDLESVLVSKLRRAESELVTERNSRTEMLQQMESVKTELAAMEEKNAELEKLVSSLEKDLERAIAVPATPASPAKHRSSELNISEGRPDTLQSVLDPDAPKPPESDTKETPRPSFSSPATERAEDDHSVATIVMAQRDRLRARCEALEAERDSFKRELQAQVSASESLKADNTKLYEKVRYLQNYSKQPRRATAPPGDRDLDLEALEQRYEASVDPFRQFSKAERQRKLNEMSPMERTVFIVAKTFLGTLICRGI